MLESSLSFWSALLSVSFAIAQSEIITNGKSELLTFQNLRNRPTSINKNYLRKMIILSLASVRRGEDPQCCMYRGLLMPKTRLFRLYLTEKKVIVGYPLSCPNIIILREDYLIRTPRSGKNRKRYLKLIKPRATSLLKVSLPLKIALYVLNFRQNWTPSSGKTRTW